MNPQVDEFINALPIHTQEIAKELRLLIFEAVPEITEEFKWSKPSYSMNGLVCYMQPAKEHVNFGFYRGAELAKTHPILQGDGSKMRHIRIAQSIEIDRPAIVELVQQAVALNQ